MAADAIITVENLGKKYRLGAQSGERYAALRDVIADKAKNLFRRNGDPSSALRSPPSDPDFWAPKDINFEVRQGEVLGIVGGNRASRASIVAACLRQRNAAHKLAA